MNDTTTDAAMVRHNGAPAPAMMQPAAGGVASFLAQGPQFMQLATDMSTSDIIPKDFRKKPANVFLALEMAHRLNLGPMEVMQNLYVVHGTPSLSSKFLIGLANRSGRFKGGLRFDANDEGVTCYATDRETGDRVAVTVTWAQAEQANWTKNTKYKEMGEQMLSYRAATFFVRRYCPEVMLGMMTVEEANELPRPVEAEASADPLDAALAPLEAPDETAKDVKAKVHEPEYAPAEAVSKLVLAFDEIGVDTDRLTDEYGPLDQLDAETFKRAREDYKAMKAQAKAAVHEDAREPSPVELFEDSREGDSYDPDKEPF